MNRLRSVVICTLYIFVVNCAADSHIKEERKRSAQAQKVDKSKKGRSTPDNKQSGFDKEKLKKCVEECLEKRQQQSRPYPEIRSACEQECSGIRD
jgi:hypothetical protein